MTAIAVLTVLTVMTVMSVMSELALTIVVPECAVLIEIVMLIVRQQPTLVHAFFQT